MRFSYLCSVDAVPETGQVLLTCEAPSAITWGKSTAEAAEEMHSLLLDLLADALKEGTPFPPGTDEACGENQVLVSLTPTESLKVLLINAMVETGTRQAGVARSLGVARQQVTRIVNPKQRTSYDVLCAAIEATGRRLKTEVA